MHFIIGLFQDVPFNFNVLILVLDQYLITTCLDTPAESKQLCDITKIKQTPLATLLKVFFLPYMTAITYDW